MLALPDAVTSRSPVARLRAYIPGLPKLGLHKQYRPCGGGAGYGQLSRNIRTPPSSTTFGGAAQQL